VRALACSSETVFWHAVSVANAGKAAEAAELFRRCFEMDLRWKIMVPRIVTAGLLKNPPSI
jgi:hypothetical protein